MRGRKITPIKGSKPGKVIASGPVIEWDITPVHDLTFHALCSVLIVEDDFDVRQTLCEALAYEGYQVSEASNGKEALAIAHSLQPSVILLDLNMPVMSGREFQVAKKSDLEIKDIPVIAISAANDIEEVGANLSFAKPFDIDLLIVAIDSLINETRKGGHHAIEKEDSAAAKDSGTQGGATVDETDFSGII